MALKKQPFEQAPQVGDSIRYKGKLIQVCSINPDDETFLIEIDGEFIELSGDDWEVYKQTPD